MEFEEIKRKNVIEMSGIEGEAGLVTGRSQREKRRSYKDLLREEEEVAAQDSELVVMGGDVHTKKKKQSSNDYHYKDPHGSGPAHKKKRKSSECSPSRLSSCSSQPAHSTDTAMGLLQAITSPMATGSEPGPNIHKKPSYPPHTSHSTTKDRKRDGSSKGSHSFSHSCHSRSSSSLTSSKKHTLSSSSKSSLFHAGAGKTEPLTLRDGEGLKMKLILSPKERSEEGEAIEGFPFPTHSSGNTGHHSSALSKKSGMKKEKDRHHMMMHKPTKKKQNSREALPMVGKEVEVEGQFGGSLPRRGDCSSSGGELEAGELIIDDSYTHLSSKKKKKSKKSKKKKDKEKARDREKNSKEKKHSKRVTAKTKGFKGDRSRIQSHYSHSSSNHSILGTHAMPPTVTSHHDHQGADQMIVKKKRKDDKERDRHDKDKKKKKSTTAYQVFCKEYRANINAEQPGLVFGELSKKLAEVWKQLPEKEKQIWKQKAQYLQHKQIKAEATTVKQKTSSSLVNKIKTSSSVVGIGTAMSTASRSSLNIRVPEVDPIDAAAHLQLLGESLSLIGHRLQETEGMVAVSGSLSVLLDSILCALGPLTCLTAQVPQLNGCPRSILSNTLDNIAYIMPGL